MLSLESPHRGDSYEYTKYTIFSIKKKITLYYPKYGAMGFFAKGLKNEFETAVVNEPSVFEPLKFYCKYEHTSATAQQCTHAKVVQWKKQRFRTQISYYRSVQPD